MLLFSESVKAILGRHTKILVKYMVKLETKGDKTENRVLVSIQDLIDFNCSRYFLIQYFYSIFQVFTPVRTYLLIAKVPTKVNYNTIQCRIFYNFIIKFVITFNLD